MTVKGVAAPPNKFAEAECDGMLQTLGAQLLISNMLHRVHTLVPCEKTHRASMDAWLNSLTPSTASWKICSAALVLTV
jgi:hypothetical protein